MRTFFWKPIFGCLLACLCLPFGAKSQEIVFSASASTAKTGLQNQFQVTFSLSNAPEGKDFTPPSFEGFTIQGGPFQSSRSNMSNVNGRVQRSATVSLTYVLQAISTGTYTIGPASVTVNGKTLKSNPVKIEVVRGSVLPTSPDRNEEASDPFAAMRRQHQRIREQMLQRQQQQRQQHQQQQQQLQNLGESAIDKNIFIKVSVDKTNPYVGEQITVSYKLYTRLAMNVNLTQLPSLNGFWSQDFEVPNPPQSQEELVNGVPYQVFLLKKTALFPQQAGRLELDAAKAEGIVRIVEQRQGQHPFADDPFFSLFMDDPFFNQDAYMDYNYKDVPVKLSSKPIAIQVKELPIANRPASFTGAVGQFSLETSLDKQNLSTDDVAMLSLRLIGTGNLKLVGAPNITFQEELGVAEPLIKDSILSRNPAIRGIKEFQYAINPQVPGTYTIPSIEVAYYDVASKQYQLLKSEAQTIHVSEGKNPIAAGNKLPGDIHPLISSTWNGTAAGKNYFGNAWYWGLYVLAGLLCGLLIAGQIRKEKLAENQVLFRHKKANKVAWKRLSTARKMLAQQKHEAFYEETSKAIWLYLSDKLNLPLSGLSKENLSERMLERNFSEERINQVQQLIVECELALYSPGGGQQQRQATLEEAGKLIGLLEQDLKTNPQSVRYAE